MGGRELGFCDGHVHTAIFKIGNQQGPTLQHMELYSTLCGKLDGREVRWRMGICTHMLESLGCSPESITTLLTGYTDTMQNKKFKKINLTDN